MGFGLLFIGYFFMLNLPVGGIDMLPDAVGWLIMLAGVGKLILHCPDNKWFGFTRYLLIICGVLSIAILGGQLASASGMMTESLEKYLFTPLGNVYSLCIGIFHALLFIGIYGLSRSVELPKLANRARRMVALTAVYYFGEAVSLSGLTKLIAGSAGNPDAVLSTLNLVIYLIGSIWLLLSWLLLFTCYMRICLEGDEDMPYREDIHDRIISHLKNKKKK